MITEKMPKLGFGLMRLPEKDGRPDIENVCRMVDRYMSAGLNYFDTAYVYHGGRSETAAREAIVGRYPRKSFYLADKLPAWSMKNEADRDRIFNEQLEITGAGYFDFYLLHSLEDGYNYDTYERLGCFDWGEQKKREGLIKHFGFSFHGTPALLRKVLDDHPEVEFVQIQLNYADWDNPVVCSGELYDILHSRNIPAVIMEPVKGGTLAQLPPKAQERLRQAAPDASCASWALRFAASLPGVMTVLSGMSNEEQISDNISTFTDFRPLTEEERAVINEVTAMLHEKPLIGCTSCRYCCDGCPAEISIPDVFKAINALRLDGNEFRSKNYYNSQTSGSGKASDCLACGQCEGVCPQHLPVIELLKEAVRSFEK